ncbi:MAG: CoA transferase [Alphaproteobacteria bacterium]
MPLSGITVVEMGEAIAGPFSAQTLGDFGATVYKVENPDGGDSTRRMGNPRPYGSAAPFHAVNRNKRSVVLDLKDPAQSKLLRTFLLKKADVFIQNLRPGTVGKLGLDPDDLRREKPGLICASVRAFSKKGANATKPGYDFLMEGFSGIMAITGEPDRPPSRVGIALIDFATAQWILIGVLQALRERDRTGQGCHIETSLFEVAMNLMNFPIGQYRTSGEEPGRWGSGTGIVVPYQAFPTQDRLIVVAPGNDRLFRKFAEALGHLEWADDPRFCNTGLRIENKHLLLPLIEAVFKTDTCDNWVARIEAAGVPAGPLHDVREICTHPELAASEVSAKVPGRPDLEVILNPLSFNGTRPGITRAPPDLGADTEEFMRIVQGL